MNGKQKNKLLFVCNQGQNRSKLASELFGGNYAGLYSEKHPLTKELLEEAQIVFVMEEEQRKTIGEQFPKQYLSKKIINLNIPDIYDYSSEELKTKLQKAMSKRITND
jgi:predicted protein tyrosine phosphatase